MKRTDILVIRDNEETNIQVMQQHNFTTQNYAVGFGKLTTSAIVMILRISPTESFPKILPLFLPNISVSELTPTQVYNLLLFLC